jgi:alpha-amylase
MGVLLQGFYKLPPGHAVPSPADGNTVTPWWWDHLAVQATELRKSGFTAIWLPPTLKSSAGASKGADGYGPFDDYDIGSKTQMGSLPTRCQHQIESTSAHRSKNTSVGRATG